MCAPDLKELFVLYKQLRTLIRTIVFTINMMHCHGNSTRLCALCTSRFHATQNVWFCFSFITKMLNNNVEQMFEFYAAVDAVAKT